MRAMVDGDDTMTIMAALVLGLTAIVAGLATAFAVFVVVCRIRFRRRRQVLSPRNKVVAFFHPRCSGGGGGERVLWKAIQVLATLKEEGLPLQVVIYTIDPPTKTYKQDLLRDVQMRFSIYLPPSFPISFVHLHNHAHYLEPSSFLSLMVEAWGTMVLAYRALQKWPPDVFIDTTGCAFTYPVAWILAGCRVGAYVHYPTISTDMLSLIWERRPSYNHDPRLAKSFARTCMKVLYYLFFAFWYGVCGSMAQLVMVNSSWTYGHVIFLWRGAARRTRIVFPPCDVKSCEDLPLEGREPAIASIGQFRPEKDHTLQIMAFSRLRKQYPEMGRVKLVLVGSCRGQEDEARVQKLRQLAESQKLADSVEFVLNQPYSVVKEWYGRASVGLHTMWNEHFGIGVVEMMAAGLLVVAHDSGGPEADIVVPLDGKPTGFLASTAEEYANAIHKALTQDTASAIAMRKRARQSASRFSDDVFSNSFTLALLESGVLR